MRILFPNTNFVPERVSKILLVVGHPFLYPWLESLVRARTGLAARAAQRLIRLTYLRANPKDPGEIAQFFAVYCRESHPYAAIDLLTDFDPDASHALGASISARKVRAIQRQGFKGIRSDATWVRDLQQESYDIVAVVYPDAIGLGCLEQDLLAFRLRPRYVVVCNGRKRGFVVTPLVLARLLALRIIDKLWLVHVCALPLLVLSLIPWAFSRISEKVPKFFGIRSRPSNMLNVPEGPDVD